MTITPKRLCTAELTAATATYYTATSKKARIDAMTVTNTSVATRTMSMWLVPNGASATDANIVVKDKSIAPGASARILEAVNHWIDTDGTIQAVASAAGDLTLVASGVEQT